MIDKTKTYNLAAKIAEIIEKEKPFDKLMMTFCRKGEGVNDTIKFIDFNGEDLNKIKEVKK